MQKSRLKLVAMNIILVPAIVGINSIWAAEEEKPKAPISNETCLTCHDGILEWETKKKDVLQPHRLHLESKRTEYNGRQKMCVTCHEAMVSTEEGRGIMETDVYHPDVVMKPDAFWKRSIQRKDTTEGTPYLLDAIRPEKPYTFKPLLERLVCLDCHGPDSKIKTFYGVPLK